MSDLEDAKELIQGAEEDLNLHMVKCSEWSDALIHAKSRIKKARVKLDNVQEEKHHPMEIRDSIEIRGAIKEQDERAKRRMYGGKD